MKLNPGRSELGFTMVEIALCLAIVGFALVAIIGVLPTGMNVQRDNRHQTIVNQDAAVWLDAIRSGARAFDDLTNYVSNVTNYWARFDGTNQVENGTDGYNFQKSFITSLSPSPDHPLTNGMRIISLLTTPKIIPLSPDTFQSNYLVAYVRSMSGAVVEKNPQRNADILEAAFTYRMIVENMSYVPTAPNFSTNNPDVRLWNALHANSRDLRLTFRWPVLPNTIGNGRQTYRQLVTSAITNTVDAVSSHPLHFFEPSILEQVP